VTTAYWLERLALLSAHGVNDTGCISRTQTVYDRCLILIPIAGSPLYRRWPFRCSRLRRHAFCYPPARFYRLPTRAFLPAPCRHACQTRLVPLHLHTASRGRRWRGATRQHSAHRLFAPPAFYGFTVRARCRLLTTPPAYLGLAPLCLHRALAALFFAMPYLFLFSPLFHSSR